MKASKKATKNKVKDDVKKDEKQKEEALIIHLNLDKGDDDYFNYNTHFNNKRVLDKFNYDSRIHCAESFDTDGHIVCLYFRRTIP